MFYLFIYFLQFFPLFSCYLYVKYFCIPFYSLYCLFSYAAWYYILVVAPLTYHSLDRLNIVPVRISLFLTYLHIRQMWESYNTVIPFAPPPSLFTVDAYFTSTWCTNPNLQWFISASNSHLSFKIHFHASSRLELFLIGWILWIICVRSLDYVIFL